MRSSLNHFIGRVNLIRIIRIGLIVIIIAHVVAVLVLSGVPPVSRDALTHHLFVPKLYLKHGGMIEINNVIFSYYPMNLDLLFTLPLYFGNDVLPKYIHFAFGLLTAGMIYRYLQRRLNPLYGLLGGLLFLSIPVIVKLSITVYVDLGLVFFSTAALYYVLHWREYEFQPRYLIFAAVFCGLALGTKYNGLITFFLLVLFIPILFIRQNQQSHQPGMAPQKGPNAETDTNRRQLKAIFFASVFAVIALLVFSPWMIRNTLWTGNPVYPLYNQLFKNIADNSVLELNSGENQLAPVVKETEQLPEKRRQRKRVSHFTVRRWIYQETWWQTALIPVRIFFQGQDNDPKYFDGRLTPILFFFPMLAFIPRKGDSGMVNGEKRVWLAYAVFYLLYAFVQTDMRIRYIAPIIPPLVILSIFGLHRLNHMGNSVKQKSVGKLVAILSSTVFICLLGMNAEYMIKQFKIVEPVPHIWGDVDRDAYIQKYRPEYTTIMYANTHTSDEANILAIFLGNRGYYFDRNVDFNYRFLIKTASAADSAADIYQTLKSREITHLLIRFDLFQAWVKRNFTVKETRLLQECLDQYTEKLFINSGHGLYRVQ